MTSPTIVPLKRISVVTICCVVASTLPLSTCGNTSVDGTYSVKQLQKDFRQLRKAMESHHPALYRFTSPEQFQRIFDKHYQLIDRPMTVEEFYRIVTPVVAQIGCGHARVHAPEGYWNSTPNGLLPLKLKFLQSGAFVVGSYVVDSPVPPGSEVVAINGFAPSDIVKTLKGYVPADGFNESWKMFRVNQKFAYLYALAFGYPDQFVVEFQAPGETQTQKAILAPIGAEAFGATGHDVLDLQFEITGDGRTAIITMKSFAYYDDRDEFYSFVDDAFAVIQQRGVENLILDFRGNDGGDPYCTTRLLSYIESRPVQYFARPYFQYEDFSRPIPVASNRFDGRLLVLIDGGCYSSTAHLCAVLEYNDIGIFVGSETGGTYTCNDASKGVILKNSRIDINMPRMTFAAAVSGMSRSRGILPDHPVEPRIEDLLEGRDTVKDFALELLADGTPH
jgi:hypothetical protein